MRYRALDSDYDMTFGRGGANFLVNSPECVAQAVRTALLLIQREWFLDLTAGVPYPTRVLTNVSKATADLTLRSAILGVLGVKQLLAYSSTLTDRHLEVTATIETVYSVTPVQITTALP